MAETDEEKAERERKEAEAKRLEDLEAEFRRIGTQERKAGERKAERDFLEKLGVDSLEDAERMLKAKKAEDDKDKSEAQRAKEAAEAAEAKAEDEKRAAAKEKHDARVERALVAAGITDEKKLAKLARLVDSVEGDDLDKIKADVKALQKEMPEVFGKAGGDGDGDGDDNDGGGGDPPPGTPPKGAAGDPPKPRAKGKPSEDAYKRGLERAKGSGAGEGDYPIMENAGLPAAST